jgi:hypothetical protein
MVTIIKSKIRSGKLPWLVIKELVEVRCVAVTQERVQSSLG